MLVLLNAIRRGLLFLVGFTLPLTGVGVIELTLPASPFKIISALLLAYCVFLFLVTARLPRRDRKAWWVFGYAVSYGIACFHALFAGIDAAVLLTPLITVGSLILFYYVLNYSIVERRDLNLFLWALVLGSGVSASPAVLGIQTGLEVYHGTRYEGLAQQVNVFGFDMMVILPIIAALFLKARSVFAKLVLAATAALAAGGILASLSRTAFVATAAEYALWVQRFRSMSSLKYLIAATAILVAVVLMAPQQVGERTRSMMDPAQRAADGSIQSRLVQFEASMSAIVRNPILGIGTRRFVKWTREEASVPDVHNMVHNAFLRIWVEQGLIGLVFFVGIVVIAWRQYSMTWRTSKIRTNRGDSDLGELGHLAIFLQISLFGSIVGGMFTHSQDSKIFWVVLALGSVVQGLARARASQMSFEPVATSESRWADVGPATHGDVPMSR